MDEYRAAFLRRYPGGFADDRFRRLERSYRVEASRLLRASLSPRTLRDLVEAGDTEAVSRLALRTIDATNLVVPRDKKELTDGLSSEIGQRRFAEGLHLLLYGTDDYASRFSAFVDVLRDMGAANWTVATYFPFLADPRRHMLLRPVSTTRVAAACGLDLDYRPEPNPTTYAALLRLSGHLRQRLQDLGPQDLIDVQSFMWCVAR
jgi:hypothetical protein